MFEVLKNMMRRRGRTALTVFGILIGIFAFTVMGSMAEKISLLVNGGTKYYADKVTVTQGESLFISGPMDIKKAAEIARVSGVAAVAPTVYTTFSEDIDTVNFGPPPSINSDSIDTRDLESFKLTYTQGRPLEKDDRGKVVIGADMVKKLDAKIGGMVKVRDKEYEVVGILDKTLTAPDTSVVMTLADAQAVYYNDLPELVQSQFKADEIVNGFTVYVDPGVDPDALAVTINDQVSDIKASGPQVFQDQVATATGTFNAILFSVALISLIVGGLSVINTMTMSVSERTREIAIKKAIGAKTRNIMFEYLTEAALIGLLGGLLGWALGAATVFSLNHAMEASGNIIFLLTTRISVFAITFSVILGILAGFYPAYRAVKLNIITALREV